MCVCRFCGQVPPTPLSCPPDAECMKPTLKRLEKELVDYLQDIYVNMLLHWYSTDLHFLCLSLANKNAMIAYSDKKRMEKSSYSYQSWGFFIGTQHFIERVFMYEVDMPGSRWELSTLIAKQRIEICCCAHLAQSPARGINRGAGNRRLT
jgi:hypothetical protein